MKDYHVYVLACGMGKDKSSSSGTDFIKVGYSTNIESRIKTLQTGNPQKIHLLCDIRCTNKNTAMTIERELHKSLHNVDLRTFGEWFEFLPNYRDWFYTKVQQNASYYRDYSCIVEIPSFEYTEKPIRDKKVDKRKYLRRKARKKNLQKEAKEEETVYA